MSKVFVISDTHFGHARLLDRSVARMHPWRPFDTVEEHDQALIDNWNRVVTKRDTVYHLGDVLFHTNRFPLLGKLNGIKRLVMGNHDDFPTHMYTEHFDTLHGTVKLKDVVFTHVPIHPQQFERFKFNVHGHLHAEALDDPRYFCASCEQIDYTPIELDVVINRLKERNA